MRAEEKQLRKQICFACQLEAHRLVHQYTNQDVLEKAEIRGIPTKHQSFSQLRQHLLTSITKEKFILNMTNMILWDVTKQKQLARKLHIRQCRYSRTIPLALIIAMVMVRENVKYKLVKNRQDKSYNIKLQS